MRSWNVRAVHLGGPCVPGSGQGSGWRQRPVRPRPYPRMGGSPVGESLNSVRSALVEPQLSGVNTRFQVKFISISCAACGAGYLEGRVRRQFSGEVGTCQSQEDPLQLILANPSCPKVGPALLASCLASPPPPQFPTPGGPTREGRGTRGSLPLPPAWAQLSVPH